MGDWMTRALAEVDAQATQGQGVNALRAAMMKDGGIDASEMQKLITIHRTKSPPSQSDGWDDFFVEALSDYFALSREVPVYTDLELKPNWADSIYRLADAVAFDALPDQPQPLSYAERVNGMSVGQADADALIEALSADGMVLDAVETRLMATLFARAVNYPTTLRNFAWQALGATVLADKAINDAEVGLLRSLVLGPASMEGVAVSQQEAGLLFVIENAVEDNNKSAEWADFFARSIGSYLLYSGGTPGRVDFSERQWMKEKMGSRETAGARALAAFLEKWDGKTG